MIAIDKIKCTGCGLCVDSCSFGAITMVNNYPVIDDTCVSCNNCIQCCPADAIITPDIKEKNQEIKDYRDIWVVLELESSRNQLRKVSLELLSEARRLADLLGQETGGILLCKEIPPGLSKSISDVGCDYLYIVQHEDLDYYHTERFTFLVSELANKYKPSCILFPATENGRDLAPRVSCAMQVGLTADCTDLDIDEEKNLIQIRPTYGGNVMASIISPNHRPQLASVRPNVLEVKLLESPSKVQLIYEDINPDSGISTARLIEVLEKDTVYKDVTEADILIVAGYGVGSKENFNKLKKLAIKMNAAIGATRKVVDEGWAPFEIQVGQTGKTVSPSVYIGCGVSGALQHTIGMKNAKYKIAINNDPAAPIFKVCDVALMGDCISVANALCEKIIEL